VAGKTGLNSGGAIIIDDIIASAKSNNQIKKYDPDA